MFFVLSRFRLQIQDYGDSRAVVQFLNAGRFVAE
jgi:hypothetical protein